MRPGAIMTYSMECQVRGTFTVSRVAVLDGSVSLRSSRGSLADPPGSELTGLRQRSASSAELTKSQGFMRL
jgi:hypothetical protein